MPPSCYSSTPDLIEDIDDAFDAFDNNKSPSLTSEENVITTTSADNSPSIVGEINIIHEPHENDILMGRGGKNNQHIGNEKLRQLARLQSKNYQTASKKGKSSISRDLVQQVRNMNPPGRFLKKKESSKSSDGASSSCYWEDVGDDIAREKTSQVLRDAVSILIGVRRSSSPSNVVVPAEDEVDFEESSSRCSTARQSTTTRRSWEETSSNSTTSPHYNIIPQEHYSSPHCYYPNNKGPPSNKRAKYYIDTGDRSGGGAPSSWPYHPAHRSIQHPVQIVTPQSYQSQPANTYHRHTEQPHSSYPESVPSSVKYMHKNAALDEFDLFNGELLNSDTEEGNEEEDDGDVDLKHGFWPVCV